MLRCLTQLSQRLEAHGSALVVREGDPAQIVPRLVEEIGVSRVSWNRDYSPYAKRRDASVQRRLEKAGVRVDTFRDRVVFEGHEIETQAGTPYTVFTPYKRAWYGKFECPAAPRPPRDWLKPGVPGLESGTVPSESDLGIDRDRTELPPAGESAAGERLQDFLEHDAAGYAERRDLPAVEGTSRLSPYLRFGTISIRSCLRMALEASGADPGAGEGIAKWRDELVWREFYHAILDRFPAVSRGPFRPEYARVEWENDEKLFAAWCDGRTGYPFVDAAMRQLNATGWMHNRARMVVASFLTKDLLVDWRWGERYFMQRLVDGDPASNNGGWQWAASTGTDAQPYFRIFNPVRQGERFDPEGHYVRQWVPELAEIPPKFVHQPWMMAGGTQEYPPPLVDHAERRTEALRRYKTARNSAS